MSETVEPIYGRLPSDWELTTVGALENAGDAELQTGPFGTMLHASAYSAEGVPVVAVKHIGDNRLSHDDLPRVKGADASRLERYRVLEGDILFARKGSVERRALVKSDEVGWIQGSDCIRLRLKPSRVRAKYAAYVLGTPAYRQWILQHAHGATMPSLNQETVRRIPIPVPPIPEQQRIADTLGALDDKIELNRRMNHTLESIARAIFESWIVDFDPVRAKEDGRWREGQSLPGLPAHLYDLFPDRVAESSVGNSPEGWGVGTLGDLSHKPQYGYTASAKSEPVGPKFLRITDINKTAWIEWGSVPYCEMEDGDREKYRLHKGDVLIARMADPGHGVMIEDDQDAVFASYLIRFRPKNVEYSRFLQYWLRSRSYWEMVKGRGAGTTRVSLNAQVLGSFPLVIPPRSVASAFAELVGCLRVRVVANASETQLLAAARDALLPKLISGELQVTDAKRTVGGVGA
jgi:type I restriction enzyme, S subunit